MTTQLVGPLLPMWETWIEFLIASFSGPALAVTDIWAVKQMTNLSLLLSHCLSNKVSKMQ